MDFWIDLNVFFPLDKRSGRDEPSYRRTAAGHTGISSSLCKVLPEYSSFRVMTISRFLPQWFLAGRQVIVEWSGPTLLGPAPTGTAVYTSSTYYSAACSKVLLFLLYEGFVGYACGEKLRPKVGYWIPSLAAVSFSSSSSSSMFQPSFLFPIYTV